MKKLVIIILTTLLTFGCFAQEFVPFELPYYEPITPAVEEQQNEMQDYAEYIEWFVEKRYDWDWEEIWDSTTFQVCCSMVEKMSKSAIEQKILTFASELNILSDYELIIVYSYAEVYLGKFCYNKLN